MNAISIVSGAKNAKACCHSPARLLPRNGALCAPSIRRKGDQPSCGQRQLALCQLLAGHQIQDPAFGAQEIVIPLRPRLPGQGIRKPQRPGIRPSLRLHLLLLVPPGARERPLLVKKIQKDRHPAHIQYRTQRLLLRAFPPLIALRAKAFCVARILLLAVPAKICGRHHRLPGRLRLRLLVRSRARSP